MAVGHDGLGLRHPFVAVDAAWECVQCAVDNFLFISVERCELFVGLDALFVEYTFELRADALDLLQVIHVVRLDTGGAQCGGADDPGARCECSGAHGVGFGVGRVFFVLAVEGSLKLSNLRVCCVEVALACQCSTKLTFELGDANISGIEGAFFLLKLRLEVGDSTLRAVEFASGCAQ